MRKDFNYDEKYVKLADAMFKKDLKSVEYYEERYPERNLQEGAVVTRFAPSPTGFVHIGGVFTALVAKSQARQTNGVILLRIEDTDGKREVENGVNGIIDAMNNFEIEFDEGVTSDTEEKGNYGPYIQSQRKDIYQAVAKELVKRNLAYPCFFSNDELNKIREDQTASKTRPGIYGIWAKYRDLEPEEAIKKIENGEKFVVRLKSIGDPNKIIVHHDVIKGKVEFPENDQDLVIIKSDGLPTYHFAHAVDDHFMRVNTIIRSDEWLASMPVHLQLFDMLEFERPRYAHVAPLMKKEDNSKRKLSKRKDKEAAVSFYVEEGITPDTVKEYLTNIANSNFENWKKENPNKKVEDFVVDLTKAGSSGALFDMVKLEDVGKNNLALLNKDELYDLYLNWTAKFDTEMHKLLLDNKEYSKEILNIEREEHKRKDFAKLSDIRENIIYMYDEEFEKMANNIEVYEFNNKENISEYIEILETYLNKYVNISDDKDTWFNKLKDLAEEFGYAREVKEYKQNKEKYKGHIGDVSGIIRVALTTKSKTPDLYEIIKILGKDSLELRKNILKKLGN